MVTGHAEASARPGLARAARQGRHLHQVRHRSPSGFAPGTADPPRWPGRSSRRFRACARLSPRARPTGTRAPIDPAAIEGSVTRSLRLLGTDYIDVLAVHEPTLQDAANTEIFDVLRRLVKRGTGPGHLHRRRSARASKRPFAPAKPIDIAQFPDTPLTACGRRSCAQRLPARHRCLLRMAYSAPASHGPLRT